MIDQLYVIFSPGDCYVPAIFFSEDLARDYKKNHDGVIILCPLVDDEGYYPSEGEEE
jgi:hypothetical protein